ncbi:glucosyl-3-phosphoglycerate synthase [Vallicoccus soli]|uniref:Glucosyl-3-phosphoglycerate synthase n=1 Tax=Vallicoccus soli TaxID=2339232 RepID=A0A3A3Z1L0_9ACTN|nr:glucosyl-3-phosphoglycerate synthase [Vallicoccus soli]RJK98130.1 glucosyl-3-phosphoglycerate synthase [Vallicoccus soli]
MHPVARAWFDRRTYRSRPDDAALAERKRALGTTVSVVVPARDEEASVGRVVAALLPLTVPASPDDVPLVDELVVLDSDSTDATAERARAAGAVVHAAADVAPSAGTRRGKGEAMWKSLFVTSGDVVVFADADLVDPDPLYVTGLLAPLLDDPDVLLVKGFYDRPAPGEPDGSAGGGRVTELLTRPVLAHWFPEVGGVVQPLAGEWAARRALLEELSFPCGYGVEVAVLLDTALRYGVDAVAQADLGRRDHRHQDQAGLGRMALQVLHAASLRHAPAAADVARSTLTQFVRRDGQVVPDPHDVDVEERPPAVVVPEYGQARGLALDAAG